MHGRAGPTPLHAPAGPTGRPGSHTGPAPAAAATVRTPSRPPSGAPPPPASAPPAGPPRACNHRVLRGGGRAAQGHPERPEQTAGQQGSTLQSRARPEVLSRCRMGSGRGTHLCFSSGVPLGSFIASCGRRHRNAGGQGAGGLPSGLRTAPHRPRPQSPSKSDTGNRVTPKGWTERFQPCPLSPKAPRPGAVTPGRSLPTH